MDDDDMAVARIIRRRRAVAVGVAAVAVAVAGAQSSSSKWTLFESKATLNFDVESKTIQ